MGTESRATTKTVKREERRGGASKSTERQHQRLQRCRRMERGIVGAVFLSHGREESEDADDVGPSEDEDQGEEGNEGRVPRQPPVASTSTANPRSAPCGIDRLNRTSRAQTKHESRRESTYATGSIYRGSSRTLLKTTAGFCRTNVSATTSPAARPSACRHRPATHGKCRRRATTTGTRQPRDTDSSSSSSSSEAYCEAGWPTKRLLPNEDGYRRVGTSRR